jgi:hypothetical protein
MVVIVIVVVVIGGVVFREEQELQCILHHGLLQRVTSIHNSDSFTWVK